MILYGSLISYQSTDIATTAPATDRLQMVSITSEPALAGTTSTHMLIGFLQSANNESGAVIIDSASFIETTSTQLSDLQRLDFSGGKTGNLVNYKLASKRQWYLRPWAELFF